MKKIVLRLITAFCLGGSLMVPAWSASQPPYAIYEASAYEGGGISILPDAAAWISDPSASAPAGSPRSHWRRFTYLPAIDWMADAHKKNKLGFDIDHPDAKGMALIRQHYFEPGNDYFLPYETPLPANFPKNYFYLVLLEQVEPLSPIKLHGKLQYGNNNGVPVNWQSTQAGPAVGQNGVVLDSASHESAAGFVWVSRVPMEIQTYAWDGARPQAWETAASVYEIAVAPYGDEFLFAALPGDEYCQARYALRRLNQGQFEAKDLATTGLGCSGE